ncbi:MAG: hypothetical protein LUF92_09715 [Clostridiales bacterium]|nr:hypothetical protein [Clostridiales bacterium]
MPDIKKIADEADMIVEGYAFTKCDLGYRVINLNNPESAVVISGEGDPLEIAMNDIEVSIVVEIFKKDKEYLEELYA